MKAAIPVFQNKIAPRLDCAEEFLIVEIGREGIESTEKWECHSTYPLDRAITLAESEVEIIICGAIDKRSSQILEANGKRVYSWHYGDVESVVRQLITNGLCTPS